MQLDNKVLVDKSLFSSICSMAEPLNQGQDLALDKALKLLAQDLSGCVLLMSTEPTAEMIKAGGDALETAICDDLDWWVRWQNEIGETVHLVSCVTKVIKAAIAAAQQEDDKND